VNWFLRLITFTVAISVCRMAAAYETYDIRQYEPLFTVKTEKIERPTDDVQADPTAISGKADTAG
jgi:hypothetical protein